MSSLEGLFVGLHALIAVRTGYDGWELTPDESKAFMKACSNVARHYSVKQTQKAIDHMALVGALGTLYGPRIAGYKFHKIAEQNPGDVVQFPNGGVNLNGGGFTFQQ